MMASQTQGIQQLLAAEKRAAEKVAEAKKRKCSMNFPQLSFIFQQIIYCAVKREYNFLLLIRIFNFKDLYCENSFKVGVVVFLTFMFLVPSRFYFSFRLISIFLIQFSSTLMFEFFLILGKARRLKQAKEEAQDEIERYKQDREKQFREFEAKVA